MHINDNLKFATLAIPNLATGGNIGTPAETVDRASSFNINQTTTGQTILIPNPSDATPGDRVRINNVGPAAFTILGKLVGPNQFIDLSWNGTSFNVDSDAGRNAGAVVTLATMTAGNNTVTHALNLPAGSFSSVLFRAYNSLGNEVIFRRVVASDTANAFVVNSSVAISTPVTFYITPLA